MKTVETFREIEHTKEEIKEIAKEFLSLGQGKFSSVEYNNNYYSVSVISCDDADIVDIEFGLINRKTFRAIIKKDKIKVKRIPSWMFGIF